jgi:uncharacterized protein YjiS (DUF1127 family)
LFDIHRSILANKPLFWRWIKKRYPPCPPVRSTTSPQPELAASSPSCSARWRLGQPPSAAAGLADLGDHLLRDIGVTRQEARRECAKRFWRGD